MGDDWGMTGTDEYNTFLYSGLEGVRKNKEYAPTVKKSGRNRALEEATRDNYKISKWIVKTSEQQNMKRLMSDDCTPPQNNRGGVEETYEVKCDYLEHFNSKHHGGDVQYVSKDPVSVSTSMCLV